MEKAFPVLGIDIGGTKIAVCLGTSDGKILGSNRISSKDKTPEEAIDQLSKMARELLAEANLTTDDLKAIGIGAPAPMDIPNGILTAPTNNPSWRNVHIRDIVQKEFGVETFLENDANAGALAEWMFGAGQGCDNMIYLTMSTGIGGGIIANGHLLHGSTYLAGELGHTVIDINGPECSCGLKGCYEAFCGGRAIALRLQKELADQPDSAIVKHAGGKAENIDMLALEKAVLDGDEYALKLWDDMSLRNAQAIGGFINGFNPQKIVLGTLAMACGDLFMDPLMKYLPDFCWKESLEGCEICVTKLGRDIGEYSGICVALNCLYEEGKWSVAPTGK